MLNLKVGIPKAFLKEEIRDDYLVTSKMKKVWAVELDLLAEAMRVMDKYSIKYYAIGGTLLGAVRHQGFIPWDDDIDIAIPRDDYERFRAVAKKEFNHPYFFQDEFNSPGLLCGHAKLRNSETTMVHSNHMNEEVGELSFNMGIFIDFFPVDNLPDDVEERNKWQRTLRKAAQKAWHLRLFTHRGRTVGDKKLKYCLQEFFLKLLRSPNYYFYKYNRILSKYSKDKTSESCLYCLYCREKKGNHHWLWNSADLNVKELTYMPFEFLRIPCPANYDAVLKKTYGNWHEKIRANSVHGSINDSFYNPENTYQVYYDKNGNLDRALVRREMEKNDDKN